MTHQHRRTPAPVESVPHLSPLAAVPEWGNQERLSSLGLLGLEALDAGVEGALQACFGSGIGDVGFDLGTAGEAAAVGGDAFTIGRQVNLGGRVPSPDDLDAVEILAHETAHALAGGGTGEDELSQATDPGEARADVAGERFRQFVAGGMQGTPPSLGAATGGRARVHRHEPEEFVGSEFAPTATDPADLAVQASTDSAYADLEIARSLADGDAIDRETALDRQRAKRELADQFEIVPDDYEGPRDPNTLTESEFRDTARLYSDIRLDRTDIKLGPAGDEASTAAFRAGAMQDFGRILQTGEGRALVTQLAHNKDDHVTQIQPGADPNAPVTKPYGGNPRDWGNRVGSNALVLYTPGHDFDRDVQEEWAAGTRSDVLLFHELAHARQMTAGEAYGAKDTIGREPAADHHTPWCPPVVEADRGHGLNEYGAIGLQGMWTKTEDGTVVTENAYRDARNRIVKGSVDGDESMVPRTQVAYSDAEDGHAH